MSEASNRSLPFLAGVSARIHVSALSSSVCLPPRGLLCLLRALQDEQHHNALLFLWFNGLTTHYCSLVASHDTERSTLMGPVAQAALIIIVYLKTRPPKHSGSSQSGSFPLCFKKCGFTGLQIEAKAGSAPGCGVPRCTRRPSQRYRDSL